MATKEQLTERAQLVRIHEANCHIPYPTPVEANFRLAIMKKLAAEYSLREYRAATVEGPGGKASSFNAQASEKVQAPNRK
jgi:hypothetical protein